MIRCESRNCSRMRRRAVSIDRRHRPRTPATDCGSEKRWGPSSRQICARRAAWAPVSLVPRRDGTVGHFPHLVERAKPGLIAVTPAGARFVDEAGSYYDFMAALFAALPAGAPVEAWLVCDHRFIRRYGLGHAMPAPLPLGPSLRSGYLKRGRTIAELARACGLPEARAGCHRGNVQPRCMRGSRSSLRSRGHAVRPRGRRSAAAPQSERGAGRARTVLRRESSAGEPRDIRRTAHRRRRARARRTRDGDTGALRVRRRHGERHGRALSQRRHHARAGDDVSATSPPIIWRRRRLQPESSGSYSRATSAISRNARSAAR